MYSPTEQTYFKILEYSGRKSCQACLVSNNATSRNINLETSILIQDNNSNITYLRKVNFFNDNSVISKDEFQCRKIDITDITTPPIIIFWVRGTYFNNDLSKRFTFNSVFFYNTINKQVGVYSGTSRQMIIDLSKFMEK